MTIRTILISLILLFFTLGSAMYAQEEIPEVIKFAGSSDGGGSADVHPSTYTGPVTFQHLLHFEEYAEGCGDCHHDSDYEPIEDYDPDESYNCEDCHDEDGLIRGAIAENEASMDDLIAHRANVLHMKCIGCHKEYNAEQHVVIAPEACRICHAKQPQKWVVE